ncbi:MAG: hypothetical protein GY951_05900 [Psychromonas sp.]|nr:hypothetical protein [Psychromonas sp.]
MLELNQVTKQLDQAVSAIGGIEQAIEACDRMYQATFRSEAFPLNELEDWENDLYILKLEVATTLYASVTGEQPPQRCEVNCGCEYDCDCSSDSFMYATEAYEDRADSWFSNEYPEFQITGETLVCDHCNYKGEGEGEVHLFALCKNLPIFKSKNDSFFQVN